MNKLIELENVTKRFSVYDEMIHNDEQVRDGFFYALDDISLSITGGECVIIAGANGSGKSVLMSVIAGLENQTSGVVRTCGKIGLVFQEPDSQILGETPREDIAFGPRNMKLSKSKVKLRVEKALNEIDLEKKADFPARSLSGGEKRRLAAAGVLAMDAEIIIFDEPYANMDYPGIIQINGLLKKLKKDGKTLIILTHELEKCLALADRFIVLFKGKKVFDGSAADGLSLDLKSWCIHNPLENGKQTLEELLW
ncbi:MAG: energy-coupling factor ABC transporter ATP-binding protein [Treponema sp.]|nr:energy-coupling factor ABC transporter ATP-binding protein [Treponema sp.]